MNRNLHVVVRILATLVHFNAGVKYGVKKLIIYYVIKLNTNYAFVFNNYRIDRK